MAVLPAGALLGRYRIDSTLGAGGMGEVYRAYDTRLRRQVAVKVIRRDGRGGGEATLSASQAVRMLREARAVAALSHPNVVTIFDVGEVAGVPFIAMELLVGDPLGTFVGVPGVALARRVRWLREIASALAAAHEAGLVHRDVKPDNAMVCDDDHVRVLDFGVAKAFSDDREGAEAPDSAAAVPSFRTVDGQVVGTPRYMAPEQHLGLAVDARADQFAWGLVAYELLAGVHPADLEAAFRRDRGFAAPARSLSEVASEVPPEIAAAVMRALSRDPAERFASMKDLVLALGDPPEERSHDTASASSLSRALGPGVPPAGRTTDKVPRGPSSRRRLAQAAAGLGLAGLLIGGFTLGRATRGPEAPSGIDSASARLVSASAIASAVEPPAVDAGALPSGPGESPADASAAPPASVAPPASSPDAASALRGAPGASASAPRRRLALAVTSDPTGGYGRDVAAAAVFAMLRGVTTCVERSGVRSATAVGLLTHDERGRFSSTVHAIGAAAHCFDRLASGSGFLPIPINGMPGAVSYRIVVGPG